MSVQCNNKVPSYCRNQLCNLVANLFLTVEHKKKHEQEQEQKLNFFIEFIYLKWTRINTKLNQTTKKK